MKWPSVFQDVEIFATYPYLLPCLLAAAITSIGMSIPNRGVYGTQSPEGSVLACFLGRDGGPRQGAIRLLPEKADDRPHIPEDQTPPHSPPFDDSANQSFVSSFRRRLSSTFSGYLPNRGQQHESPSFSLPEGSLPQSVPLSITSTTSRADQPKNSFLKTSRANGSAYGYSGSYRSRLGSNVTFATRRGSMATSLRRRGSQTAGSRAMSSNEGSDLNFAQRILMANENAVTNIADLWVAAAMNVDNEDPFESDEEEGDVDGDGDEHEGEVSRPRSQSGGSVATVRGRMSSPPLSPTSPGPRHSTHSSSRQRMARRPSASNQLLDANHMTRRLSSSVPAIFSHTGVKSPPAVLDAQQLLLRTELESPYVGGDALPPITEGRQLSESSYVGDLEALQEKPPSLASQLPFMIIAQYGLLALHSTTHDQVFMSYLVS